MKGSTCVLYVLGLLGFLAVTFHGMRVSFAMPPACRRRRRLPPVKHYVPLDGDRWGWRPPKARFNAETHQTLDNLYGNPMPYGDVTRYGRPAEPPTESFLERLYMGTADRPQGLCFNTIPDTTNVARPPVRLDGDPMPGALSPERNCGTRQCLG